VSALCADVEPQARRYTKLKRYQQFLGRILRIRNFTGGMNGRCSSDFSVAQTFFSDSIPA